jgi:hypothetical protein
VEVSEIWDVGLVEEEDMPPAEGPGRRHGGINCTVSFSVEVLIDFFVRDVEGPLAEDV